MRTQRAVSGDLHPALILGACLSALVACSPPNVASNAGAQNRKDAASRLATLDTAIDSLPAPAATASQERPLPFAGRDSVTLAEWFEALQSELPAIAASDTVRAQFDRLRVKYDLPDDAMLYADFVRVRTAFEATRAGGYWGLEWRVTDRQPQSDHIWAQWRAVQADGADVPPTSAIAECDELSALFAFVARGLGLSKHSRVGLLWPTSNHTVAVWAFDMPPGASEASNHGSQHSRELRIVLPTSQIFLDSAQGLDTDGFDPWVQARIYHYTRRDAPADLRLPAPLARAFVHALRTHGRISSGELQSLRNRRAYAQRQAASRG